MSWHNPFDVGRYLKSCLAPDMSRDWTAKVDRPVHVCPGCEIYKAQIVEYQRRELVLVDMIPMSHYEADDRHSSTMPVEFSYI